MLSEHLNLHSLKMNNKEALKSIKLSILLLLIIHYMLKIQSLEIILIFPFLD